MSDMKKYLAVVTMAGALAASIPAGMAKAALNMDNCCSWPQIQEVESYVYSCYDQSQHMVQMIKVTCCPNCGMIISEDTIDLGLEEHDHEFYDLENKRRYCKCGDYYTWVYSPVNPEEPEAGVQEAGGNVLAGDGSLSAGNRLPTGSLLPAGSLEDGEGTAGELGIAPLDDRDYRKLPQL